MFATFRVKFNCSCCQRGEIGSRVTDLPISPFIIRLSVHHIWSRAIALHGCRAQFAHKRRLFDPQLSVSTRGQSEPGKIDGSSRSVFHFPSNFSPITSFSLASWLM